MYKTRLTGVEKALKKLDKLTEKQQQNLAKVMSETAEEIMTDSKENYVPVDTGTLRATGHVEDPEVSADSVFVALGYGNQAVSYAVVQHEDMNFAHTVGQAKYLEIPFRSRIRELGKRMKKALTENI